MTGVRPLSPAQHQQHAAFLRELAHAGNARAAARAIGVSDATLIYRRQRHPAFARAWDATLAAADARLRRAGGQRAAPGAGGAEVTVTLRGDGRLQLRRARRDAFTRAAEQRFLLALAASANISLSAAAAGVSVAAVNKRRRRNPAFAREVRDALAQGYERLEAALLASWSPASGDDAAWRGNEPPALPPMTTAQALQLLILHRKRVLWREADLNHLVLTGEVRARDGTKHLARLYRARLAADTENEIAARVIGDEANGVGSHARRDPIVLPDLAQVTGWSQADPAKTTANAGRPHGGAMRAALTTEARAQGLRNAHAARRGGKGKR